jgi:hypothetical protein
MEDLIGCHKGGKVTKEQGGVVYSTVTPLLCKSYLFHLLNRGGNENPYAGIVLARATLRV